MAALSDEELWEAIRILTEYGGQRAAARATGIPRTTLQSRLEAAKERWPDNDLWANNQEAAEEDSLISQRPIPFSQDETKITDATKDECIEELWRLVKENPDSIISRNYFRVNSSLAESSWNRFFGTWHEFKRQAGIVLTRHAHRLEMDIAKHASVDIQRDMNREKGQWEGAYRKPSGKRFQSVLVISDLHDVNCDEFVRRVFLETANRLQPEKIVLNGDCFDCPEFSRFTQDPREFQLIERIKWVHAFLSDIREICPDTEIIFIEGNHEARLLKHMAEATQGLKVILSDLHGFTVPKLLGLDRFEVNFIARADLTAWTERDIRQQLRKNYVVLWDSVLFGHFPEQRQMGYPGANGHCHKHIVWAAYNPSFGPFEWHQTGCGHVREASYMAGEGWSNGFLIGHVDTANKRTQFEYVDLSHPHAFVGGKWYERSEDEAVLDLVR